MTDASIVHDSFTLERIYPNCREHVWSAWAMPAKKATWFGGGDHSMDFRAGGGERAAFRDGMGEHVNETRYFEIAEGERIVFAYSMAVNGRVHGVARHRHVRRRGGRHAPHLHRADVRDPAKRRGRGTAARLG
jgi:uncharacterized protein YndB with AHSA1/START domain